MNGDPLTEANTMAFKFAKNMLDRLLSDLERDEFMAEHISIKTVMTDVTTLFFVDFSCLSITDNGGKCTVMSTRATVELILTNLPYTSKILLSKKLNS